MVQRTGESDMEEWIQKLTYISEQTEALFNEKMPQILEKFEGLKNEVEAISLMDFVPDFDVDVVSQCQDESAFYTLLNMKGEFGTISTSSSKGSTQFSLCRSAFVLKSALALTLILNCFRW